MMRKIAMVLAAVAVVTAGSASTAAARFGGGFHGGGFSHGGGFGHPGFGRFDRDRFGRFDHDRSFGRHRFGHRFAVFGVGYPYGYYDDCYSSVWTPRGYRWSNVCY